MWVSACCSQLFEHKCFPCSPGPLPVLRFRPRISTDSLRSHCVLAESGLSYSSRQVIQLSKFNRPKGPPLVSSLGSLFPTLRSQCSQNIYIFNLPQQRNVALLLFVKGKKTRNWIGAFWDYFSESAYLRIRGRPYEISRKKVFTNWSLKAVNDEYFRKKFIKISPHKFFVSLNFHRKGHIRQHKQKKCPSPCISMKRGNALLIGKKHSHIYKMTRILDQLPSSWALSSYRHKFAVFNSILLLIFCR